MKVESDLEGILSSEAFALFLPDKSAGFRFDRSDQII